MRYTAHSAKSDPLDLAPLELFEGRNGRSFVHDASRGLPHDMMSVSLIYAELPWIGGWEEFNRRAVVGSEVTYKAFAKTIEASIVASGVPAVLLVGAASARLFDAPKSFAVRLNYAYSSICSVLCINFNSAHDDMIGVASTARYSADLLARLAESFASVGDFACGYGNSGRIFANAGRRYVMSDINGRCIRHISQQGWA